MPDLVSDEMILVYFVVAIAVQAAPTVAELNAGTRLDQKVTADGLKRDWANAKVDNAALSSGFDTERIGRRKPDLALTFKRQTGVDAIQGLTGYKGVGFVVIRDNIIVTTGWTIGQACEVYPVECGEATKANGPNTIQRRTVEFAVTDPPSLAAVVA